MTEEPVLDDIQFADEEKLRHEVAYLQERLKNLEVFKKMFFTLQEDLVVERQKYTDLEGQLDNPQQIDVTQENALEPDASTSAEPERTIPQSTTELQQAFENLSQLNTLLISAADEYLEIIDFYRESSNAKSVQDVISLMFFTAESFKCNMSAEVRCNEADLFFSSDETLTDEHTSLVKRLKIQGRFIEEDDVICINHTHISLLMSDLSKDDVRKYGRVIDNLKLLAAGANTTIGSLDARKKLVKERGNLYKIVKGTHQAMEKIEKGIGDQIRKTSTIQNAFVTEVANAVEKFKIPDEDKNKILALLASGKKNLSKVLMESFVLDEHFLEVISKLEKTYSVVESAEKKTDATGVKKQPVTPAKYT